MDSVLVAFANSAFWWLVSVYCVAMQLCVPSKS